MKRRMSVFLVTIFILGLVSACSFENHVRNTRNAKSTSEENISHNEGTLKSDTNETGINNSQESIDESTNVSRKDFQVLKGKVICIDPGHQAKGNNDKEPMAPGSSVKKEKTTSGTAGVDTKIPEYKLNLEVALLLRVRLVQQGAKVIMTRESNNVDLSNIERAKIANESNADITIRIHADGAADSKVRGGSVLYPGAKYIKDEKLLKLSREAANKVRKQMEEIPGTVSAKIVERNDLTGFNWSKVPVILVEMGFMSNPEEDRLMKTQEFRKGMADAILCGIIEYFEAQ